LIVLFLAQKDYARAEEMANLLRPEARLLRYPDLSIKATAALAYCEAHTNRIAKAREDYAFALCLAQEQGDSVRASTLHHLLSQVIDFMEMTCTVFDEDLLPSSLRAKLQKGDHKKLLARLCPALDCRQAN